MTHTEKDALLQKLANALEGSVTAKTRRPVATMAVGNSLMVVCDDGSVWSRDSRYSSPWTKQNPIPGTAADQEPD